MAHNLDTSTGRAAIAFLGSRNDVWHQMGQEMKPGQTMQEWAVHAGLDWHAVKVPAVAVLEGPAFDHLASENRYAVVENRNFIARDDNGYVLGYASNRYQPVQPVEILEWFEKYISVDDRFALDVAGSLKGGEIVWATATFTDGLKAAGDEHKARLLMTTTFDGSGSTINKGTMTRVVCNNTLDAALADRKAVIRTRHNTKFDGDAVSRELATVAQSFVAFAAMGNAMALNIMSNDDISAFFRGLLDIPFDAKEADVSGRKRKQFQALNDSYKTTITEGTERNTAWAALNAVTRYVDHDSIFSTKQNEKRFMSTQFGGGADLKAKAVALLTAF